MLKTSAALALAAGIAFPALAATDTNEWVGQLLGTTQAEITSVLEERGIEIVEFEIEDDEIEVSILQDGQELELEIDPQSGLVTEAEIEDDDD
jgi:uncharacterized membrane protein YkoI